MSCGSAACEVTARFKVFCTTAQQHLCVNCSLVRGIQVCCGAYVRLSVTTDVGCLIVESVTCLSDERISFSRFVTGFHCFCKTGILFKSRQNSADLEKGSVLFHRFLGCKFVVML